MECSLKVDYRSMEWCWHWSGHQFIQTLWYNKFIYAYNLIGIGIEKGEESLMHKNLRSLEGIG